MDNTPPPPPAAGLVPVNTLAPGNYDRAWNDPPLLSSTAPQTGGSRLTKRVGFPTSTTIPNTGQDPTAPPSLHDAGAKPPPCMLPPPPSSSLPPPPSCAPLPSHTLLSSLTSTQLEDTLGQLTKQYFEDDRAAELDKRLGNLVSSHRNNSLGTRVPGLVEKLVLALSEGNMEDSRSYFTTLSTDHGGESGNAQWMVALRHLVTKVEQQHSLEGDNQAITAPL